MTWTVARDGVTGGKENSLKHFQFQYQNDSIKSSKKNPQQTEIESFSFNVIINEADLLAHINEFTIYSEIIFWAIFYMFYMIVYQLLHLF